MILYDSERDLLSRLSGNLSAYSRSNTEKYRYYEGTASVRNLEIAVPANLSNIGVVVGWPATTVDVQAERMGFLRWTGIDNPVLAPLESITRNSDFDVEFSNVVIDSLLAGVSFMQVTAGESGVEVSAVSPSAATGDYDPQTRLMSTGYQKIVDPASGAVTEYLYTPDSTVIIEDGTVVDRLPNVLGRIPLVRFGNKMHASHMEGRSEITPAIRYYTDHAARTMLGMEINREFYTTPQRWAMNADMSQFGVDEDSPADERRRKGWEATAGRMLALPPNGDGTEPSVGQFSAAPPTPYIDEIRCLSQMVAAEAALPASYFGFVTENPSSADAIRQEEIRLLKRIEDKQRYWRRPMREIARLALGFHYGSPVDEESLSDLGVQWLDPAAPTNAATADEVVKLVGAGVIPATSRYVLDRLRMSESDRSMLERERRADNVMKMTQQAIMSKSKVEK